MYTLSRDPSIPPPERDKGPEPTVSSRVVSAAGFLSLWAGIALGVLRFLTHAEFLWTMGLLLVLVGWFLRGVAERLEEHRSRSLRDRLVAWLLMSLVMIPVGIAGGAAVMAASAGLAGDPLGDAALRGAGVGAVAVGIVAVVALTLEILEASVVEAVRWETTRRYRRSELRRD
jgi:hypothetical protein